MIVTNGCHVWGLFHEPYILMSSLRVWLQTSYRWISTYILLKHACYCACAEGLHCLISLLRRGAGRDTYFCSVYSISMFSFMFLCRVLRLLLQWFKFFVFPWFSLRSDCLFSLHLCGSISPFSCRSNLAVVIYVWTSFFPPTQFFNCGWLLAQVSILLWIKSRATYSMDKVSSYLWYAQCFVR
jgi:hypothetical protein